MNESYNIQTLPLANLHHPNWVRTVMSMAVFFSIWISNAIASNAIDEVNSAQTEKQAFVKILSDEEAWAMLPALAGGTKQPLPIWARAVAAHMP